MLDPGFRIEFGSDRLLPAFCAGFNAGFVDYKYGVQMDEPQMVKFLARSGIDLEQSAVLLHRNGANWRGAGVALVALEDGAAWCSGLAVAPTLRGGGFGRRLMEAIQARAAAAGALTLWLEALVHNTPARRLYASLGYQPRRDLLFWRTGAPAGQFHDASELHAANVQEALVAVYAWQHQPPAWQRSQRAITRYQDELWAYRLQDAGETAGWIICLPTAPHHPGQSRLRIMTLAVRPDAQQTTLAHRLLASLRAHRPDTVFTVINEPETSLFTAALQDNGFVEVDRQIEMVLALPVKVEDPA
ncbi:GNAT family N-acetyltransferase [Caldilinea sp.]|mgnify:FL=1|uniref:GNAT family N-acetyltransferase n=1 Tax=Caldilinea sp. TaxID=2293560 RepID=UPI002C5C5120|nr:GNAT family N-acetyltransferase [Caldilinea sp.]HRA67889.1 GNAT family N-acetyltransferase [Caldilinea sp.]